MMKLVKYNSFNPELVKNSFVLLIVSSNYIQLHNKYLTNLCLLPY